MSRENQSNLTDNRSKLVCEIICLYCKVLGSTPKTIEQTIAVSYFTKYIGDSRFLKKLNQIAYFVK